MAEYSLNVQGYYKQGMTGGVPSSPGTTTIETMLKSGDIALVKIKGKTIKVVMR